MVKIYFYDNVDGDQRLPHEGAPATAADLAAVGVYATNISEQSEVDRIAEERGYKNRDEVLQPEERASPAQLGIRDSGFGIRRLDEWLMVGRCFAGEVGGQVSYYDQEFL